jgi:hypothetical protein
MSSIPLGLYAIFFEPPFYPWLLMLAVTATSMVMAAKS